MKEKETAKLIEIYESKRVKRAIYSQCKDSQYWDPGYDWPYRGTPLRC